MGMPRPFRPRSPSPRIRDPSVTTMASTCSHRIPTAGDERDRRDARLSYKGTCIEKFWAVTL